MAITAPRHEYFEDAFESARYSPNRGIGIIRLRRARPELTLDEARHFYNSVEDRANRVRYIEDSNQGHFFSRSQIGCPETGNMLLYTFEVHYHDDDGNQFTHYIHTHNFIERRIGDNTRTAVADMMAQLRDRYRGRFQHADMNRYIQNAILTNVRCIIGGN